MRAKIICVLGVELEVGVELELVFVAFGCSGVCSSFGTHATGGWV